VLITARNVHIAPHLRNLYDHLLQNGYIESLTGFDPAALGTRSGDVLQLIRAGDPAWARQVPPTVAAAIRRRGLFGHPPAA